MAGWRGIGVSRKLRMRTTTAKATISQNEWRRLKAVARKPAMTKVTALATAGMPASTPSAVSCWRPW